MKSRYAAEESDGNKLLAHDIVNGPIHPHGPLEAVLKEDGFDSFSDALVQEAHKTFPNRQPMQLLWADQAIDQRKGLL